MPRCPISSTATPRITDSHERVSASWRGLRPSSPSFFSDSAGKRYWYHQSVLDLGRLVQRADELFPRVDHVNESLDQVPIRRQRA